MPREATGSVRWARATRSRPARWQGRFTLIDQKRTKWIDLPIDLPPPPEGRELASSAAQALSDVFRERGITVDAIEAPSVASPRSATTIGEETFAQYAVRWFVDRERRGLTSISTDKGRLKNHVEPVLRDMAITAVTTDDLRAVVEALDNKVLDETLSWSTAVKVWGVVTKLFNDASCGKVAALRVLTTNPVTNVRGPDRGAKKAKQWLYPREAAALLSCPEVPLRWRRLYALAIYLYPRPGELAALDWRTVHVDESYVHILAAYDLKTGDIKDYTKTKDARKVFLQPELVPLLDVLRAETGGVGLVLQHDHENKEAEHGLPYLNSLSATLRDHLRRAGVTRSDLFEDSLTTKQITFYDLRATGITWEVLAGTTALVIRQRAGHTDLETTLGYVREAETLGRTVGDPFPALPPELLVTTAAMPAEASTTTARPRPRIVTMNRHRPHRPPPTTGDPVVFMASPTGFEPVLQP